MEVLDGQQRLAAIRDFVHNEFAIDGRITPSDDRIQGLDGQYYRRLGASDKRLIDNHTLRCFRITDYSPDEPSELFYRLNQPSMLTAGEQRNAFYGPAREQLKDLVQLFEARGNEKASIGFSNVRLAYDDIIARLLFFLEMRSFAIKGTEALISQRFKKRDAFSEEITSAAARSIEYFSISRERATALRLNKASTLSWLIFFSRFAGIKPHEGFLEEFNSLGKSASVHFISQAVALFYDRSSLRVTDVTSVVYRDVVLWYAYYFAMKGVLPKSIQSSALELIADDLKSRVDVSFEYALSQRVDINSWSRLS